MTLTSEAKSKAFEIGRKAYLSGLTSDAHRDPSFRELLNRIPGDGGFLEAVLCWQGGFMSAYIIQMNEIEYRKYQT